jgi:thioredoxin reductase (NADPH)
MEKYDVIIIGGGPAGVAASIYTARGLLKTLVIEKTAVGGQIVLSDVIENYPGFPKPLNPTDLLNDMQKQAENFGVKFEFDEVKEIIKKDDGFTVKTDWDEYEAKGIILAVGSSAKKTGVPGEEKFIGKGVAFCATCDAPFFKDRDIAIIGAGNSGIQEGLFALNFVKSIKYIEFLPKINAEKILQERIKEKDNVEFFLNTRLMEVIGDNKIEGIRIKSRESGEEKFIKVDGVFLFVGNAPNTNFLKGFIELDERGYIIADHTKKTSIEGVFAAGDAVKNEYSQVVISAGSGVTAAMSLISYLENKK